MQVSKISKELNNQNANWWLHALDCIEKNKDSMEELIRKIDQNVTRSTNGLGSARVSSRQELELSTSIFFSCFLHTLL